ncbi:hypothetical protein PHMEG_00032189 [Phytophthora megakarya]|uniref:Uncharacterized protein n=1 Tax=Phytophthora megakarya TaxID=4795 RepID=A0A225UXN7_9STRA|nr:hypothetical protein PHMEG_00032189 [Phytophthora megakarya]
MTNSFLRVTFPKMDKLNYNNSGSWRCLEFKNCTFWQSARSVSSVNLPANKFAMFFEFKCPAHYETELDDLHETQTNSTPDISNDDFSVKVEYSSFSSSWYDTLPEQSE